MIILLLDLSLLYVPHIWSLEPLIHNKTSLTVWFHLFVHHSRSRSTTRLCLKPTICLFFKQTTVSVPHQWLSCNTLVLARGSIFAQLLHNHLFFLTSFATMATWHQPAALRWCTLYPSLKSNSSTINIYCFHKNMTVRCVFLSVCPLRLTPEKPRENVKS